MNRPWEAKQLKGPLRIVVQAWRRWWLDRCSQAASSLAYQTALALVPLLAVAFALLKASGQLDARSALLNFLGQQILPSSQEARSEIVQRLAGFADNVAVGALGGVALAFTIVTGFMLFLNVEEIWNQIWAAHRRRSFVNRFLLFYAAVTLLPFLMALSLWHTAALWTRVSALGYLLSLLATPTVLTLANRLLPVARVSWRAALWGGVTSGALFELAKYGFGLYLAWVTKSYRSIYGALGILPLFFLWIYVAWLTVLWGAEMAHAAQRLLVLEAVARSPLGHKDDAAMINGPVAARLLCDVVRHYMAGKKALPADQVRQRHCLSEHTVWCIFRRLEEANLVIAVDEAYVPARPPAQIRLDEVLSAFEETGPALPGKDGEPDALGQLLLELTAAQKARTAAVTLADLVQG